METQELMQLTGDNPMTSGAIKSQVNLIQDVMKSVMKDGEHYGVIPGTGDKKTLFKSGAEKLMMTFRIAPDPEIEDLSGQNEIRYRIKVKMISHSGIYLGSGVGECSTNEDKYMWRKAVCEGEYNATQEGRRRIKWGRNYTVNQVRTNPSDLANTVLKMAKKRALVDGTLTVLAASDLFSQDFDDISAGAMDSMSSGDSSPSPISQPKRKSEKTTRKEDASFNASPAQIKRLWAISYKSRLTMDHVKAKYGLKSLNDLLASDYEEACKTFEDNPKEDEGREPGDEG